MIAQAVTTSATAIVLGLVGGGGLTTGLVALYKMRADRDSITVRSSEGALLVQTGVIATLREELARMHDDVVQLRAEVSRLGVERSELRSENFVLRQRVTALEADLAALKPRIDEAIEAPNGGARKEEDG